MFERNAYHCPNCGYAIGEDLTDGDVFACAVCSQRFRVLLDEKTGQAAFYEELDQEIPEPLNLPRGSIRALVALAMAASSWVLLFAGRDVPGVLLSLVLTILGYYFGFRTKVKSAEGHVFDPSARRQLPLFLPTGFVRWFIILGFVACGVYLHQQGRLMDLRYFEFFLILMALIGGYLFAKAFARTRGSPLFAAVQQVKAAAVLLTAAALAVLFVTGLAGRTPRLVLALCAVVSFYFGSRH